MYGVSLASAALLYNLRTKSVSPAACSACRLANRSAMRKQSQKESKAEKQKQNKNPQPPRQRNQKAQPERLEALLSVCLWPYLCNYFPQTASKVVPHCDKENPALSSRNTHVVLLNSRLLGPSSCSGHEIYLLCPLGQTHAKGSHQAPGASQVALGSCR